MSKHHPPLRESARLSRLIAGRDLAAALDSSIAPVVLIASLLLVNTAFMNGFFLHGRVEMSSFFQAMPLFLAVFLPALSMRLFAEEHKTRTIEVLFSLPISPREAVLGKYLAALGLFVLFLLGTLPIPGLLLVMGEPDLGAIVSGYLGVFLIGAELLALGVLASAITSDQIVAFIAAAAPGATLVLLGDFRVKRVLDGLTSSQSLGTDIASWISPLPVFEELLRGVVGVSSLIHFGAFTAFFLWAAAQRLDRKNA
ncbi:MAG: ABC transporter permease [Planctomycetota bacterium]|nr:ABC transporter permease [Planctomycetota bacterium]